MTQVAVVMIVVFGLLVVVYPMLFGPNQSSLPEPTAQPLVREMTK